MPYEIQQSRWDKLVRRVSGSIGPGSRVGTSISDLFPVFDVENVPGELYLLAGTRIAYGGTAISPAAGDFARVQLFNPLGSGVIITCDWALVSSDVSTGFRWAITNTALTTNVGVQRFRDSRRGITDLPVGQIRAQSDVTITPNQAQARIEGNTTIVFDDQKSVAVLTEGFGFEFGGANAARVLIANFNWRERAAEQSELNLP